MNRVDQVIRTVAGIGMIYVGFIDTSILDDGFFNLLVGIFGVVNVAVGLVRVCPVYFAVGISTLRQKAE
jgi:hypothetical protein